MGSILAGAEARVAAGGAGHRTLNLRGTAAGERHQ